MPTIAETLFRQAIQLDRWVVGRQPDAGVGILPTEDLPWVAEFEKAAPAIAEEYDALRSRDRGLVRIEDFMGHSQGQEGSWHMYAFVLQNKWRKIAEVECPNTVAALRRLPGLQSAFFSIAGEDFHLQPHQGWNPGVLRLHLGIKVGGEPGDVWIRVADDLDYWENGKAILFDDNQVHEVQNRSGVERVVLFCEIRRPLPPGWDRVNQAIQQVTTLHPVARGAERRFAELDAATV